MFILWELHIRCTPLESRWKARRRLGSRSFQDHLLVSVTSRTVFLTRVLFDAILQARTWDESARQFPPLIPAALIVEPSLDRIRSGKIRYHFYHFKGQLPLATARNCDSLRVSANAVLFCNSGCRHPLRHASRSEVGVLRNRRVTLTINPGFRYFRRWDGCLSAYEVKAYSSKC